MRGLLEPNASVSAPQHLLTVWPLIERQIRRAGRIAIFSDFDGTLTSIRRTPGEVSLREDVRDLLKRLSHKVGVVGIVSGRSLSELQAKVLLRGIWYVGDHGFSALTPNNRRLDFANQKQRKQMRQVYRFLYSRLMDLKGIGLENKGVTCAVHYRNSSRQTRERARRVVFSLAEEIPGLALMRGKKVWELIPRDATNKGEAVRRILRQVKATHSPRHWLAMYFGDDTTDETVFQGWKGISVAVGKRTRTAARFYVRSAVEVRQVLTRLERIAK